MLGEEEQKVKKPFKFINVLTMLPSFTLVVEEYWGNTEELFHSTSALFHFSKKLKALKSTIRNLSKDKLGDLSRRAKEALADLCEKQKTNNLIPSNENQKEESKAYKRWEKVADLEEAFLKRKSKLHWLNIGDRNNKTFYRAARTRETKNGIREIKCTNGLLVSDKEEIKEEAINFFSGFLGYKLQDFTGIPIEGLEEIMEFKCSDIDKQLLIREVIDKEVKDVLFSMPTNKSPGPDGYTTEFFKAAWPIIGKDFTVGI